MTVNVSLLETSISNEMAHDKFLGHIKGIESMRKENRYGIKLNDRVTIDYVAKLKNEKVVLSSKVTGPLTFKVGHFSIIEGLNKVILGMHVGETKNCSFSPEETFGVIDDDLICAIPLSDLPENAKEGQRISDKDNKIHFTILNIDLEKKEAILNANHILAGQVLDFIITVLKVRRPSSSSVEIPQGKQSIINSKASTSLWPSYYLSEAF